MSVAVCIHKCIRNGYIDTVTCTCSQAVFYSVRNNHLDHKFLFMKQTSKLPFAIWREQGRGERKREREHCDGINNKLQKMRNLPFINKRFICYILSLYLCLQYFKTGLY